MSYLVLARKYRPRSFEQLVGQEHVVQALANALRSQRLHHAYLFTGTRGVGKTTVSRILAKSLNCTGPDGQGDITPTPCGVCDACRDIDAGRHVDYIELDAASNRGVEEIGQLLDQAVYKPVVGRFKVYMIDEVHMLSNHAFNAMLKTLEEPPAYLKFVLATTDPQKVPPTVLSRCLQFNLRPMAPATVQAHLREVLGREGIEAEPGALRLIARAAQGSMRDALSLTDQAIAFGGGTLAQEPVRQMLGAVDRGQALQVLEALAEGDAAALVAQADSMRALGLSAAGLLEELAGALQTLAVLKAVPDAQDADEPDAAALAGLAGRLAADELQLYYSIAVHGRAELGLAPDEYSALVMVLLRMQAFRPVGAATGGSTHDAPAPGTPASRPATRPAVLAAPGPASTSVVAPRVPAARPVAPRADPPAVVAAAPVLSREPRTESQPAAPTDEAPPPWIASEPASPSGLVGPASESLPDAEGAGRGARWAALVAQMSASGALTAMARELAWQAQWVGLDRCAEGAAEGGPDCWRFVVERESLRTPVQRERLQAALSATLGHAVRVELAAGVATDSPALRDAAERARRQQMAEDTIHADPFVQSLMRDYPGARIVPGSIRPQSSSTTP